MASNLRALGARAGLPALAAAVLAVLSCTQLAAAQSYNLSYGGSEWALTSFPASPPDAVTNGSIQTTFWWGNETMAQEVCFQVENGLNVAMATYAFSVDAVDTMLVFVYFWDGVTCQSAALPLAANEPADWVLSAPLGSPPDCTLAVFNPPILSSRLNGQICATQKALRRGTKAQFVTNVTLSLMDANNQSVPATINITDIVTNKITAGWQCTCRPMRKDNCTCLANAVLLGGGMFSVLPQWRRSTLPGKIVDTTLQVSFTATGSGGSCSGTAVLCSAWGVRPNRPAPACMPFNDTGVTRPALTCI